MKTTVQLSEAGQLNIPAAIRDMLRWQSGMEFNISIIASGLLIHPKHEPKKKRRMEELRGLLKHKGLSLSNEQLCAPVDYSEEK
jgi:bifunctional DNA-binding transcriptional regulator/antitoxin component of YhaV-PrlF toxin-antitoxin module